jgi:hypothetical protein
MLGATRRHRQPAGPLTTRELLLQIVACLPKGWQATYFPSHVIVYRETREYTHGSVITRS